MDSNTAVVIALPVAQPKIPSCHDCIHAAMGSLTFCTLVGESILDETRTAADCPDYERKD